MADLHRQYEIRCPIHGFITLNSWEREIVSQPSFQRLRRIRQLAWTDQVYPGAMHTRFEHSLGVMHTATLLYSAIRQACSKVLQDELGYKEEGLNRDLQLVRLAALLHDVGHAPFSHAAEALFPDQANGKKYKHENYSAAIVRTELRSAIEDHPLNETNYGFKAEDIAALLEGSTSAKQRLFWRDLIDGQMDSDRMDYLLRDSFHAGVQYGRFDLNRLVNTVRAIPGTLGRGPRLGISEGGCHAAEGLVLARYFMFTQVYFHKTRVAFDVHLKGALQELLPSHQFPSPTGEHLKEFLSWDDWKVLGLLASGQGGEHGSRLANRDHYRLAYHSPEISTEADLCVLENVKAALGNFIAAEEESSKSWYKTGPPDVPVVSDVDPGTVLPLSTYSNVVLNMKPTNQVFLYVRPDHAERSNEIVRGVLENERTRQGSLGFTPGIS
ncbi:MAG TPA: HD domain-containing protein [Candidatus Acidoferrum sp.]|nr:HD domain-containing protein [Candidatus Acidoferrum sp.]